MFFCWGLEGVEAGTYFWVEGKGGLEEGVNNGVGDAVEAGLVEFGDGAVVGHHFALHLESWARASAHLWRDMERVSNNLCRVIRCSSVA